MKIPDLRRGAYEPATDDERHKLAARCMRYLNAADRKGNKRHYSIPVLIDTIDNKTKNLYHAWHVRVYVIDKQGKVVYQGKESAMRYNLREMEVALKKHLGAKDKTFATKDPTEEKAKRNLSYGKRWEKRDPARALKYYESAIRSNPGCPAGKEARAAKERLLEESKGKKKGK